MLKSTIWKIFMALLPQIDFTLNHLHVVPEQSIEPQLLWHEPWKAVVWHQRERTSWMWPSCESDQDQLNVAKKILRWLSRRQRLWRHQKARWRKRALQSLSEKDHFLKQRVDLTREAMDCSELQWIAGKSIVDCSVYLIFSCGDVVLWVIALWIELCVIRICLFVCINLCLSLSLFVFVWELDAPPPAPATVVPSSVHSVVCVAPEYNCQSNMRIQWGSVAPENHCQSSLGNLLRICCQSNMRIQWRYVAPKNHCQSNIWGFGDLCPHHNDLRELLCEVFHNLQSWSRKALHCLNFHPSHTHRSLWNWGNNGDDDDDGDDDEEERCRWWCVC